MFSLTLLCTLLISTNSVTEGSLHPVIQDEYQLGILACKLFNESALDCSRRELIIIPPFDKQNATSVDLSENKIELISPIAFAGQKQLTFIDLKRNQLVNITGSPFTDLNYLVYLNLSRNMLSHLASTAFRGLCNLKILDVSNNKLKMLPNEVFQELKKIKVLMFIIQSVNFSTKCSVVESLQSGSTFHSNQPSSIGNIGTGV